MSHSRHNKSVKNSGSSASLLAAASASLSSASSSSSLTPSASSATEFESTAINCHACGTVFNLIHRRHHCRKCLLAFCGSCSSGRILLLGYGDAPVRVCDDCKAESDRAKFEARKSRAEKRQVIKSDDELLAEFLGFENINEPKWAVNDHRPLYKKETAEELTNLLISNWEGKPGENNSTKLAQTASNSSQLDPVPQPGDSVHSLPQFSAEELRQQAQEQKAKASKLRKDGLTEAAHRAFKRAKELEKQADLLEPPPAEPVVQKEPQTTKSNSKKSASSKEKSTLAKGSKSGLDSDFMDDLKELGWTEDAPSEPSRVLPSVGSEPLSTPSNSSKEGLEVEIRRIKLNALAMKREGNLTEALAELKKAKMLEKQIEEMAVIGDVASDSDDEEDDGVELPSIDDEPVPVSKPATRLDLDLNQIAKFGEVDEHVDVDDADMDDPEMSATLKAMGWDGDDGHHQAVATPTQAPPKDRASLEKEMLDIKKNALMLKREGKVSEALAELKRAKLIEKKLEEMDMAEEDEDEDEMDLGSEDGDDISLPSKITSDPKAPIDLAFVSRIGNSDEDDDEDVDVDDSDLHDPDMMSALKDMGWEEDKSDKKQEAKKNDTKKEVEVKEENESLSEKRERLQKEILSLKQSAISFKKAGNLAEATSQLKKAKALEAQLTVLEEEEEEEEVDVTEDDENDPELLAALSGMGWKEDKREVQAPPIKKATQTLEPVKPPLVATAQVKSAEALVDNSESKPVPMPISDAETLREEIRTAKIRTVNMKKEGKLQEAREEFIKVKQLEKKLAELESNSKPESIQTAPVPDQGVPAPPRPPTTAPATTQPAPIPSHIESPAFKVEQVVSPPVTAAIAPSTTPLESSMPGKVDSAPLLGESTSNPLASLSIDELKSNIHDLRLKALNLKREGKVTEAMEELKKAKLLEMALSERTNSSLNSSAAVAPPLPLSPSPLTASSGPSPDQNNMNNVGTVSQKVVSTHPPFPGSDPTISKNPLYGEKHNNAVSPGETVSNKTNVEVSKDAERKSSVKSVSEPSMQEENKVGIPSVSENSATSSMNESEIRENIRQHKLQALALKKEGKLTEASQELKLAKQLELQLSAFNEGSLPTNSTAPVSVTNPGNPESANKPVDSLSSKGLNTVPIHQVPGKPSETPRNESSSVIDAVQSSYNPNLIANLEHELRLHENKATTFVIQGNFQEAEREAKEAMKIQKQIDELQNKSKTLDPSQTPKYPNAPDATPKLKESIPTTKFNNVSVEQAKPAVAEASPSVPSESVSESPDPPSNVGVDLDLIQNEIKKLKLQALNLKKEGNMVGAKEALMQAKLLEKKFLSSENPSTNAVPLEPASRPADSLNVAASAPQIKPVASAGVPAPSVPSSTAGPTASSPKSENDITLLKQQIVELKRKALTLKREGNVDEAREFLKQARALESQVEATSGSAQQLGGGTPNAATPNQKTAQAVARPVKRAPISRPAVDLSIDIDEDELDAKLMANLKSLGLG